jgi:hypothetical protein
MHKLNYIAPACLWANGQTLGCASPVIYQIRNASGASRTKRMGGSQGFARHALSRATPNVSL